jgi:hypothetical protein
MYLHFMEIPFVASEHSPLLLDAVMYVTGSKIPRGGAGGGS